MDDCIFCKIISKKLPAYIFSESRDIISFLSLEGHPLIVPKKHIKDIFNLSDEIAADLMKEAVRVSKALKDVTNCDGINLIQSNGTAAGQDVFHFHMHIKPRWKNDDVTLNWNTSNEKDEIRRDLRSDLQHYLNDL